MARPNTTGLPYLIVRPDTGKYAYFGTLPDDYRSLVAGAVRHTWTPSRVTQLGARTIKISLQTGDERTAKDRWSIVHSQIQEHIARAVAVDQRPQNKTQLELREELKPAEINALAGQIRHDFLAEDDAA